MVLRRLLLILGLLLCAGSCWAATPTVSQAKSNQCASVTTCAVTISTTSGHLVVVFVYSDLANSGLSFSITDSASQTYTQVTHSPKSSGGANGLAGMWYKANSAAVTSVTCQASASGTLPCVVYEIAGAATGTPFDANSTNADTIANTATGTSLATTSGLSTNNGNDILIYGVGENANQAMASNWTAGTGYTITTGGALAGRAAVQTKGVTATQSLATTTMSWTTTGGDRIGIHAAFADTNQGGTVCTPTLMLLRVGRCG